MVDLGCGGGFDCLLASKEVGSSGKVIGFDMTQVCICYPIEFAQHPDVAKGDDRVSQAQCC